jgi:hypothetical protein
MRAGSMVVKALLIGLLGSGVVAVAQAPAAVLVELFTSEGCSSCPPADSLLEQMVGKHAPSGQLVITLSEHVTYWNHDGWVDPFSQELFTERQNAYARRFHLDSPYTPQMVIDGNRQVVGNDGGGILKAIGEEARGSGGIRIVSIKRDGKSLDVTYEVTGDVAKAGVEVYAVVADDVVMSQVGRGENGGRTLTHVSVARSLERVAKVTAAGTATVRVAAVAPARENAEGGQHLVLFVQQPGQGDVLGVAATPLEH